MAKSGNAADFAQLTETIEVENGVRYSVKRNSKGEVVSKAGADPIPFVPTTRDRTAAEVARLIAIDPKLAKTEDIAAMLQALLRRS